MTIEAVMRRFQINCGKVTIVTVAIAMVGTGISLESDKHQSVLWRADGDSTMSMDGDTRSLVMTENVRVTQGTLEILGDEAVFEYRASTNELTRVTVHGSPVNYQQQLDEDGAIVKGSSDTLLFYTDEIENETVLELVGNAVIESPDSAMSCASIIYIADRDLIREATGPCEGILSTTQN
jgi:lipopolysaccharide transport protein LptA